MVNKKLLKILSVKNFLFIGVLSLFVSACTVGPKYKAFNRVSSDSSLIYVYRPYSFAGSAASPQIFNSNSCYQLTPGGYFVMEVASGEHLLTVGKKPGSNGMWGPENMDFKFRVESKKDYFFKFSVDVSEAKANVIPLASGGFMTAIGPGKSVLTLIDPVLAFSEISEAKLVKTCERPERR